MTETGKRHWEERVELAREKMRTVKSVSASRRWSEELKLAQRMLKDNLPTTDSEGFNA